MATTIAPTELMARLQAALGDQYRLERELGHGGMGIVFLARDLTLDRPVAVKVVHPELAAHTSITERFLAEARMIARLRHPGIIGIHTAGEVTGIFYYVMDYVAGENLRDRLQREQRLPAADVRRIVAELADALHAAGGAGLVHRDIKPENILIDRDSGRALITDFGIARIVAGGDEGFHTARGLAVGTPTYMSPEQAAGEAVDPRSDLYSLGVVAYELLAGRPPFRAKNAAALVSKHLGEQPTPVESLRPDVPLCLARAIGRALQKDPAERWQSGADFRHAVLSEQKPKAEDRRIGRRWILAAAALVMVLGIGFIRFSPDGPPAGLDPRHSLLILPFDNLRDDAAVEWLRDGSVSMLALTLSQWRDLFVVDHERLHDLLTRRGHRQGDPIGLAAARRLARDAGAWTVVLGEFIRSGDSLRLAARVYDVATGNRVDAVEVAGLAGIDARPLFDALAARLLDLSGAPGDLSTSLTGVTTVSLEAYRDYLGGITALSDWQLATADSLLAQAVAIDSSFALAHYKLALTRGWLYGAQDSIGIRAIRHATQFASRLPERERAMIEAYRLFLQADFQQGAAAYRLLLANDSLDADAWYGLGDVTFHDADPATLGPRLTESVRAFKRAISLDPGYFLAYEHLEQMYRLASRDDPDFLLLVGDSVVFRRGPGAPVMDTVELARAVLRARAEGLTAARTWLAHQPANVQAQNALIRALSVARAHAAALAELDRMAIDPASAGRADLPFLRAQVLAAQGQFREAARLVADATDSVDADDFDRSELPIETVGEVLNGANLLAYSGRARLAGRDLDLAADIASSWMPGALANSKAGNRTLAGHLYRGHLLLSMGAPSDPTAETWRQVAERARTATESERAEIAHFGWPAAVGLFLGDPRGSQSLRELEALGGGSPPPELLAFAALDRGDSATARRLLTTDPRKDDSYLKRPAWSAYRRMIAAELWHRLGEEEAALKELAEFQVASLSTEGFDVRWLLIGQAHLLRGQVHEAMGNPASAKAEYRAALEQWSEADDEFASLIQQARGRLGNLERAG
ncbi:MAG: protein kinase [Gemmatimonadota bacterium]|nr:protein kinase [Gemmatimonadota bacterium]